MLTGEFADALSLPFGLLPLLLTMLGTGLWTEQLGRSEAWRFPGSFLIALLIGALLTQTSLALPYVVEGIVVGVILVGLMVVLAAPIRGLFGAALVVVVALYQGYGQLGGSLTLLGWLGLACGVLLGLAAGIGLAAMAGRAFNASVVRGAGLGIMAVGIWLALERL